MGRAIQLGRGWALSWDQPFSFPERGVNSVSLDSGIGAKKRRRMSRTEAFMRETRHLKFNSVPMEAFRDSEGLVHKLIHKIKVGGIAYWVGLGQYDKICDW